MTNTNTQYIRQLALDNITTLIDNSYNHIIASVEVNRENTLSADVFDELVDNLNKIGSII
jgi:hypothetical protein